VARIDDLLGQIADAHLRDQLKRAVGELRRRKKFGLVFEEHIPETTLLPAAGVHEGSAVILRKQPEDATRYTVAAVNGVTATVQTKDSKRLDIEVKDLLVVKPFGEPVTPVLTPLEVLTQDPTKPYHAVINGENFHALQLALFGLEGSVDFIYIDPPYNTGARDWKYNNDYVDAADTWRHSKWLSFMEKRLELAKRLLKPDGVLVVTIDANEVHHLGMLLEKLFIQSRPQMVTICITPSGSSGDGLSRVDEHAFFCFLGGTLPVPTEDDMLTAESADGRYNYKVRWESLLRGGNAWYRSSRENLCYPVLIDTRLNRVVGVGEPLTGEDEAKRRKTIGGYRVAWPLRADGKLGIWRVEGATLMALVEKGYAYVSSQDDAGGTWTIRYLMSGTIEKIASGELVVTGVGDRGQVLISSDIGRRTIAKTLWHRGRHTAGGIGGTQLLSAFLGERDVFTFPKSVYAVRDCIEVAVGDRRDALVLDFFAGSGTTLHATALLNAQDGGRRRCILVTNNEVQEERAAALNRHGFFRGDPHFEAAGIFESATRPRVKAALTGNRPDGTPVPGEYIGGRAHAEGFSENAAFFRMDYADADVLELGHSLKDIVPVLWLVAGGHGDPNTITVKDDVMLLPEQSPFAVLLDEDRFKVFVVALCKRPDLTHVWLVTDSERAFARMREQVPGDRFVGMLYRDYLRNFRINAEAAQ